MFVKFWLLFLFLTLGEFEPQDNEAEPFSGQNVIWSVENAFGNTSGLSRINGDPADLTTSSLLQQKTFTDNGNREIFSVSSNFHTGKVYYTHVIGDFTDIYELHETSFENKTLIHRGLGLVYEMAVDWSTNNVYWSDQVFSWIAVKSITNNDIHDFRILVEEGVSLPRGLAIDPTRRYLFWANNGGTKSLVRASMDGESPIVIAVGGIYRQDSLTIDINTGRVYWTDRTKRAVESCDSNGQNRRILSQSNGLELNSIAYYKGLVFVTEQSSDEVRVYSRGGGLLKRIRSNFGEPREITIHAEENQPMIGDGCQSLGCDHFCVNSNGSPSHGARCLCQEGYSLSQDGQSCSGSTVYSPRLLAFTATTRVCLLNMTGLNGLYCPVADGLNITALAPDSNRRMIYYADRGRQKIYGLSLADETTGTIVGNAGQIEGLSFDWITRTLFWTDSSTKEIKSFDINTNGPTRTVMSTSDNLGRLTIDPFTKRLYWITRSPFSIKTTRYDITGGNSSVVTTNVDNPRDIRCDPVEEELVWTDQQKINRINTDGSGHMTLRETKEVDNDGLFVTKSYSFWTSFEPDETSFYLNFHINGRRESTEITVNLQSSSKIVDIDVVDSVFQRNTRGVCFENGGCDQHCVPTGGTRECQCELGFVLQADGRTCRTEYFTGTHLLVVDSIAQRFYQVDITTGRIRQSFRPNVSLFDAAANPSNTILYWTDRVDREIRSSNLDGSSITTLTHTGDGSSEGLTVDPVTGNVFFTVQHEVESNITQGYIGVVSPEGRIKKTLITGLHSPRDIALHSSMGVLIWTDVDTEVVERANMDGSARRVIINGDGDSAHCVAIDTEENLLYWSDWRRNVIERCSLFGANRRIIVQDPSAFIAYLLIHEDKLYYTAWNRRGITVANKADGSNRRLLVESYEFVRLTGFTLIQPNSQQNVANGCSVNNGGCSSLCLPTSNGRTCACADGVSLTDRLTCDGDSPRPTPGVTQTTSTVTLSSTEAKTTAQGNNVVIVASATAGAIVFVVIIITVTAIFLIKRRRKPSRPQSSGSVIYSTPTSLGRDSAGYCYISDVTGNPPVYSPDPPQYETPITKDYITPIFLTSDTSEKQGVSNTGY